MRIWTYFPQYYKSCKQPHGLNSLYRETHNDGNRKIGYRHTRHPEFRTKGVWMDSLYCNSLRINDDCFCAASQLLPTGKYHVVTNHINLLITSSFSVKNPHRHGSKLTSINRIHGIFSFIHLYSFWHFVTDDNTLVSAISDPLFTHVNESQEITISSSYKICPFRNDKDW